MVRSVAYTVLRQLGKLHLIPGPFAKAVSDLCLLVMREIMEIHWLAHQTCQLIRVFMKQVRESRLLLIF